MISAGDIHFDLLTLHDMHILKHAQHGRLPPVIVPGNLQYLKNEGFLSLDEQSGPSVTSKGELACRLIDNNGTLV